MSKNLNYYRLILKKVSFEPRLFEKELKKAYVNLSKEDFVRLDNWVKFFVRKNTHLNSVLPNYFGEII
jgi:hypothetical protein